MRLSGVRTVFAALFPLVLLAACGSAGTDAPPPSVLDGIAVSGTTKAPTVTFKTKPVSVKATTTKVITAGKGAKLSKSNSIVFNYTLFNAKDGKQIETSFGKGTVPLDLSSTNLMKGLSKGLTGQLVGSRLLVAIPPADAFGAQGNAQAGVGPTDTIVFLIDVVSAGTPLATATGAIVPPKAGLPTATVDGAKPANITVRKTAVPTKLVVPWRSSSTSLPRPEPSFRSLQWTVLADPDGDLREIR